MRDGDVVHFRIQRLIDVESENASLCLRGELPSPPKLELLWSLSPRPRDARIVRKHLSRAHPLQRQP